MVRIIVSQPLYGKKYIEAACLSADTKPAGDYVTGSIITEVDTGKVFFYNEEASAGSEWVEQFSFRG